MFKREFKAATVLHYLFPCRDSYTKSQVDGIKNDTGVGEKRTDVVTWSTYTVCKGQSLPHAHHLLTWGAACGPRMATRWRLHTEAVHVRLCEFAVF